MPSIGASVKFRPVKIGLVVRRNHIEDLVKAAELSTLLWGGVVNPIIPVGEEQPELTANLLDVFSVDVLYAIGSSPAISLLMDHRKFLRHPDMHRSDLYYEDSKTKKNVVGYLDLLSIINKYWEEEFRHKEDEFTSGFALPSWDARDPLATVFSLTYGNFPKELNLKYDYRTAYIQGLKASEILIDKDKEIDPDLLRIENPLSTTMAMLEGYLSPFRPRSSDGAYFGRESDFIDLVNFWNLRASGRRIQFVSLDHLSRYHAFLNRFMGDLDALPQKHQHVEDNIAFYCRPADIAEVTNILTSVTTKKRRLISQCDDSGWNDRNVAPTDYYFSWSLEKGSIELLGGTYHLDLPLPAKDFLPKHPTDDRDKAIAVTIDCYGGSSLDGHTFNPPYIPELNEDYGRKLTFNPWAVRVAKDGFSILTTTAKKDLSLFSISHKDLISRVLSYVGIKSEPSQPGRLADHLIKQVHGVEGIRVFKIRGVRELIDSKNPEDPFTRSAATNVIWNDGNFRSFENLYIETRDKPKLDVQDVFDYMLKHNFFRAGLELICDNCNLSSWLGLQEISDFWPCSYCGFSNQISIQLKRRGTWMFRKSGLLAKDNHQEGAIPVALTLLAIGRILDSQEFIFTTGQNLSNQHIGIDGKCETDLIVMKYGRETQIDVMLGECKSTGGEITSDDVEKLSAARDLLVAKNFGVYLMFSKTADHFTTDEIALFQSLEARRVPLILFTNRELEPYHPYWLDVGGTDPDIPIPYAQSMEDLHQNSISRYIAQTLT